MTVRRMGGHQKACQTLDGQQRMPAWTHVTALKDHQRGLQHVCRYHLSEMHVAIKSPQQWGLSLMIYFSVINVCTAMEKGSGKDVQQSWKLTSNSSSAESTTFWPQKISKSFVLRVSKPLSDPLTTFTWQAGYTWSFNLPVHVSDLGRTGSFGLCGQTLQYAGTKIAPASSIANTWRRFLPWLMNTSSKSPTVWRPLSVSVAQHRFGNGLKDGMERNHQDFSTPHGVNWLEEQSKDQQWEKRNTTMMTPKRKGPQRGSKPSGPTRLH